MNKKLLIIFRNLPYASFRCEEGIDMTLLASGYNYILSMLFLGDGLWAVIKNQQGEKLFRKNINKLLKAFPLYDIEKIYILEEDLASRNLVTDNLILSCQLLNQASLNHLLHHQDIIMNF